MFRWTLHLKGQTTEDGHAAVAVGQKVYSFGGYMNDRHHQIQVRVFNTVSLRWMKLPPVATGIGECTLEGPSLRDGYTAVLISYIIYIWGTSYREEDRNVLYAFDVDTHRWFKPTVSGVIPLERECHSACVLGKVMYVYGGWVKQTGCHDDDIIKLDTTTMVWSLINTRGTPPPTCECHSATIIGTKMFVFGGYGVDDNSIRVFDTETNCWLSTPAAQLLSKGREDHSAFSYNGELYIFMADNSERRFKDLWKFNPETFSWKKVEPKGKGPCTRLCEMCCCMVGDCIILFGAWNVPGDMYILDLSPSLKTLCKLAVIRYGLDQAELTHDVRWELAAMTTSTSNN